MNMVRCPNCHINLTPAESKALNCPICGNSLGSLNVRTFDPPRRQSTTVDTPPSYDADAAAESAAPRLPTSTSSRRRSGGGLVSKWWVIPLILLLIRGGLSLSRWADRPSTSYPPPPSMLDTSSQSKSVEFDKERGKLIVRDPNGDIVSEIDLDYDARSPDEDLEEPEFFVPESSPNGVEADDSYRP